MRRTPTSSPTNADSLTWRVTFSEDVKNVGRGGFLPSPARTATVTDVTEATASTVYDVTASGGDLASLDATVTLSFASDQDIADTSDNNLSDTAPTGTKRQQLCRGTPPAPDGGVHRAPDPDIFSHERGQPDLEGDLQRGRAERGRGGFCHRRHDADGDRGDGLDGVRRDGVGREILRASTPR